MKRIVEIFAVLMCMTFSVAHAQGVATTVDTAAGAAAQSSQVNNFNGSAPSPVIGLPSNNTPIFSGVYGALPVPPSARFQMTDQFIVQFGPMEITDPKLLKSTEKETDDYVAKFSPTTAFGNLNARDSGGTTLVVNAPLSGKYSLIGSLYFETKNDKIVTSPEDKAYIAELMQRVSGKLGRLYLVPVPDGYGVAVAVKTDGTSFGIVASIAQLVSKAFLGVGPSASMQNGIVSPVAKWGRQYVILVEDANGIPFVMKIPTPQEYAKMQAEVISANAAKESAERNTALAEKVISVVTADAERNRAEADETRLRLQAVEAKARRR